MSHKLRKISSKFIWNFLKNKRGWCKNKANGTQIMCSNAACLDSILSVCENLDCQKTAPSTNRPQTQKQKIVLHAAAKQRYTLFLFFDVFVFSSFLVLVSQIVSSRPNRLISVCNTITSARSSLCQNFAVTSKEFYASRLWMTVVDGQACWNFLGIAQCYGQMLHIAVMLHNNNF